MPNSRSLRRVVFVWLLRAWALRCWWYVIVAAVFSSSRSDAGWSFSHQERTNAATALCNWHTVTSVCARFFFPFLSHRGEKQVADRRQDQVTFQPQIAPALVLIQTDFTLVILKTTLDAPARKSDQQQGPDAGCQRRVADEELDLLGIQHIAGDDQMQALSGQSVLVFDRDERVLAFPYHRSLIPVLDPPG